MAMRLLLATVLASVSMGASLAATPTGAQKEAFYDACTKRGDAALCACKADFAVKALDERMMGYVVAAMAHDTPAPADVNERWNDYIIGSMQACGSGV